MSNHPPKVVISGRVSQGEKVKLEQTGHTVPEAIHYFISQHADPVSALEVDVYFKKREIIDLKTDLIIKENELEKLESSLDSAKKASGKFYPELYLRNIAKDFIRKYEEDVMGAYKGKSIHDALNMSHKGLYKQVSVYGFSFDDIRNEVLCLYNKEKV